MRGFIIGLIVIAGSSCTTTPISEDNTAFGMLTAEKGQLGSASPLAYSFSLSGDYRLIGPDERVDVFDGVPFEISRAAFLDSDSAVMIHAEKVRDASGASNYENLPVADWPGPEFRSSGDHCIELSPDDIAGEPDPQWLLKNDFDPTGTMVFGQYFTTTDDHNHEIVISLVRKVSSCENADQYGQAMDELKSRILVKPRG